MEGLAQAMIGMIIVYFIIPIIALIIIVIAFFKYKRKSRKKFAIEMTLIISPFILFYVYQIMNHYSFTSYEIIDNKNLLEKPLQVTSRDILDLFKLSNNNVYAITKKFSNNGHTFNSLNNNQQVMIDDKIGTGSFLYIKEVSHEFNEYIKNSRKPKFIFTFSHITINRYTKLLVAEIEEINIEDIKDLDIDEVLNTKLDNTNCCDMRLLALLIQFNSNSAKVINKENLLHAVFNLEPSKYYKYRSQILNLMLTKYNVNINQLNSNLETVILHAVKKTIELTASKLTLDDKLFINGLLDTKVNLNLTDTDAKTPFMYAVENKNYDLARLILKNGYHFTYAYPFEDSDQKKIEKMIAKIELTDNKNSLIQSDNLNNLLEIMKDISSGKLDDKRQNNKIYKPLSDIEYLQDQLKFNPLNCCNMQRIDNILKQGKDMSRYINWFNLTSSVINFNSYHYYKYRTPLLKMLLNVPGVDPNKTSPFYGKKIVNNNGKKQLAHYGEKSILSKAILKKVIFLTPKNATEDFTQLDREFIQMLLNNGVDQNKESMFGITPLILAIQFKQYQLAKFLIENGADFNHKKEGYKSAKDIVIKKISAFENANHNKPTLTAQQYKQLNLILKLMGN